MNRTSLKLATIQMVMFVLIFNAVTSSVAYAGTVLGQQSTLFCTSQGYKRVDVKSGISVSDQVQQHCKVCLSPSSEDNISDLIANTDSSFVLLANKDQARHTALSFVRPRLAHLIAQGRAPPINTL